MTQQDRDDGPCSTEDVIALVATVADEVRDVKHAVDERIDKMEVQVDLLADVVMRLAEPLDVTSVTESPSAVMAGGPGARQCPNCDWLLTEPLHVSPDGHGARYLLCGKCGHTWKPE